MKPQAIHEHRVRGTFLVAGFVVATAVALATAAPLTRRIPDHMGQALVGLVTSAATFALTLLVAKWERLRLADLGAAPAAGSVTRFAAGFLAGLTLSLAWAACLFMAGHVRWIRTVDTPVLAAPVALLAYLALACREELAFRGYPLRRLAGLYGPLAAQVVMALLFALEHVAGGNTWTNAFLGAGTGAVLFGMAALATRGLAVPLGLHAAWNVGRWVLGGWDVPGYWRPVVEPGFEAYADRAGLLAYVSVMLAAIAACWWIGRTGRMSPARAGSRRDDR
ncbi:MAG TPA: CPBP family intramembrane glutamic endopeptidase [Candidatus Polarisedimenticolaceae bacterium]|nr:CPBP family intramembrane glutamic endopeptidase [Candidatus Polarisedimenticolaceae bacterium]